LALGRVMAGDSEGILVPSKRVRKIQEKNQSEARIKSSLPFSWEAFHARIASNCLS
jgi:hypothetical protein